MGLLSPIWFSINRWWELVSLLLEDGESPSSLGSLLWYHPSREVDRCLVTDRWRWKSRIPMWSPLTLWWWGEGIVTSWQGWKSWLRSYLLWKYPGRGVGTPCYNLMRMEVYLLIWTLLLWVGMAPQFFLCCLANIEWLLSAYFLSC